MTQITHNWVSGGGPREFDDINPRGWAQVDFSNPSSKSCCGYECGCQCNRCLAIFQLDSRSPLDKIRRRHEIQIQHCKGSYFPRETTTQSTAPLCTSVPMTGLPPRVLHLADQFDALTSQIANLHGPVWLAAFAAGLADEQGDSNEWGGTTIWAAASRPDLLAFSNLWAPIGTEIKQYMPSSRYPTSKLAGYRAPFVDIGVGSSLAFFWALNLDWDTQISGAFTTAIAYWADMKSGTDAPDGELAKIFDVMPSLAQSCATGTHDNLAPMKALAMEYLRVNHIVDVTGPPPSVKDVWFSRMADVGAQEACVLMTGCNATYSTQRSAVDTRCLVAWGVIHDLFDLPRDLVSMTKVNAAFWAIFSGYSGQEIIQWLRDSVALAVKRDSCAATLLLCTAFVHVTNPRWSVNGLAIKNIAAWPQPPNSFKEQKEPLSSFVSPDDPTYHDGEVSELCQCKPTDQTRALKAAALDALHGSVEGFASHKDRLDAHDIGMSALLNKDWDTLVSLSRVAWKTFWDDIGALGEWLDSGKKVVS